MARLGGLRAQAPHAEGWQRLLHGWLGLWENLGALGIFLGGVYERLGLLGKAFWGLFLGGIAAAQAARVFKSGGEG